MKSKLGVSVGLIGAMAYFSGLFSGYIPLLVIIGYVLIYEDNEWLRYSVIKALLICVVFSLSTYAVSFLQSIIGTMDSAFQIFGKSFDLMIVSSMLNFIQNLISTIKIIVLLSVGWKALHQRNWNLKVIDQFVRKHLMR